MKAHKPPMTIADPCYDPRGTYCVERDPLFVRPQPHPDHFWDGVACGVVLAVALVAIVLAIAALWRRR